ncbi:hypothetical protein [Colwellia sp. UCD-KL20]|uniref:hypothetical protein n=1 Tax=Colwellia sp. UCD-KL20 TaxID=1917165 RepID=UPI0009705DEA|nr:hypothetical protein [Colwellia sp. UCD-KL20]
MSKVSSDKKEKPKHKKLLSIIDEYLVDLECLREMHASVVPVLQAQDKERKDALSEIFRSAKEKGEEKSESPADESTESQEETSGTVADMQKTEVVSSDADGKEKEEKKKITLKFKPTDVDFISANIHKIEKAEKLFEKQLVVTLVSRFDEFLGKILKLILEQNPEWVISADKTISYKDLIALKSVDKAIQGIIYKEVEDLLRDSHEKQIQYIDDKLKIGIGKNFSKLKEFLEVAERRNLFVHTGGTVSGQYIDKCKSFGCNVSNSLGEKLGSDIEYFNSAFLVYFEIGLRIGQGSYRRIFANEMEIADRALNNLAVKFMNLGEYSLAEVITEFDLAIPEKLRSSGSEFLYFSKINRAVSQKFQGKVNEK